MNVALKVFLHVTLHIGPWANAGVELKLH